MNRNSVLYSVAALATIFSLAGSAIAPRGAAASPSAQADGVRYGYSEATGKLTFVGTSPSQPMDVPGVSGVSALGWDAQALGIVAQYADALGLSQPARELRVKSQESAGDRSITRYQQVYRGIPVMGGELVVHTKGEGYLVSLNGEVSPDLSLDTSTRFNAEQASSIALEFMRKWYPNEQAEFRTSQPELWIYDPRLLENRDGPIVLGWRMEVTAKDLALPVRELVLVDAKTGNVPLHFNQIDTAWHIGQDPSATETSGPTAPPTEPPAVTETPAPTEVPTETPLPTGTPVPTETVEVTQSPTEAPSPEEVVPLVGATWYVATTGNDANSCSSTGSPCATINGAIGKATAGDTVKAASGTYTGSGSQVVSIPQSLTVTGGWNGNFDAQDGTTIIDGQGERRGITVTGADVALDNIVVRNGYTGYAGVAGGIYNDTGSLTLTNSTVSGNSADTEGGGIVNHGTLVINESSIRANTVGRPGWSGGGGGAGIMNSGGTLELNDSSVSSNQVVGYFPGSGIRILGGTLSLNNSTVSGNAGPQAIYNYGNSDLNNSTISRNTGTGIYNQSGNVTLRNSILAQNTTSGAGSECSGNISSLGHNLIGSTASCTYTSGSGDLLNVDAKLGQLLGSLGYVTLHSDSPAIDAGNPASCPDTDQRGMARPQGAACDIGAYEYVSTPGSAASAGVIDGANQHASAGTSFSKPLSVYVVDSQGSAVGGVTVTFTAPGSGASGTFADTGTNMTTSITDSAGVGTSSAFTAGNEAGNYNVTTTISGLPGGLAFSLSNVLWYVAITGSDENDCASPLTPCATINGAIEKAAAGEIIHVTVGTYTGDGLNPVVLIAKDINISGGWNSAFSSQTGTSTITGENLRPAIAVDIGRTASLERVTVRNSLNGISSAGSLTVRNSTIAENSGSGLGTNTGGSLIIENTTIANNTSYGISDFSSGSVTLRNSILANNGSAAGGPDCYGEINIADHNIIGDTSDCSVTAGSGNLFNVDPLLGPLLTEWGYFLLLVGSPAIDAGNPATCLATDQRGMSRPQGSACDIGAYEYLASVGPATSIGMANGSGQRAAPGTGFAWPLSAYAVDALGDGVGGVSFTFTAPESGASGTFADTGTNTTTAITTSSGVATASTFTANNELGNYTVSATVSGVAGWAEYSLTNVAWFVTTEGNDSNSCATPAQPCLTINAAIAKAEEGDTVRVAMGYYAGDGSSPVVEIQRNITISGGWNSGFTTQSGYSTIDGEHAWVAFLIQGNSTTASINHVSTPGGGILNYGTLLVDLSKINGNYGADIGGAIWNQGGSLTISNSTVNGNRANSYGGAIYNVGTLMVNNSTLNNNRTGGLGGAIYNAGTLTINNSTLSSNRAGQSGGTVYNASGTVTLNGTTLSGNDAGANGGGIYSQASLTMSRSTISNNRARTMGGGIYQASGPLTLKNATISGNLAETGGGLYLNGGNANLNNLTITQNAVTSAQIYAYGGGIYVVNAASLNLKNSLIAGNTADLAKDCSGVVDSGGNNLIGWADGCSISAGNGNLLGTRTAPIDALLGNLQNNGGSTFTHALLTGSPAIDAGNPATCLTTDQRGIARPVGAACDIGAFEGSASQTLSGLIRTYTAGNQQVLPGTFRCDQTNPACTSGANPHADKAHKFAIGTWNLYKTKHGRIGIDGDNMPVLSTVHFMNNYQNAFWSGAQMVYGDGFGFPNSDDVVAHELTHGVTQYESGLFYYMESGAINESLSDVWGEYYDQTNGLGNDTSGVKWKIGEDVTGLGAIRSMSNPPAYNDPDRMLSSLFYKGTNDLGGVHQNSGVNNKTAFLMARGGSITFNGKTVTGLGWLKTAAVYYEAQTHYLTTASDYADLYNILYQSCLNLVGTRGITTANCQEVRDATDAVEMNKRPAGYRVQTGFCPAGQTKSADLFYDGLETNATKWSFTHQVGNNHWTRQNFYPVAGSYHLFGNDYDPTRVNNNQRSKSAAQFKNGVAIPASGAYYLHFKHAFEFETSQSNGSTYYWDGAVLEYSTNGGSTWVDAKPLFNAGKNYGGTVTAYGAGQSPLAGRQGFVDTSNGYVSTRYKLSTLAGQTVKFRWVVGTDYTGWANLGWAVDEIRIYRCVP